MTRAEVGERRRAQKARKRTRARLRLAGGQGSHVLSGLVAADGLAVIPETVDAATPGMEVDLWWSDRP